MYTLLASFIAFCGVRWYMADMFYMDANAHIVRAVNAGTTEVAIAELDQTIAFLESEGLTSGIVSVVYENPVNDIGFWYRSIVQVRDKLLEGGAEMGALHRTAGIERLTDAPTGISVYPYNVAFAWWGWISFLGFCVAGILNLRWNW